jgi:methyl farnesoate epoxidase/farnesoate epoxidase
VANDQASIKEFLSKKEFDGRSDTIISRLREPDFILGGVFFIDREFWKDQRRFSLRHLRDFGHGTRNPLYEMEVADEIGKLIQMIKEGPKYKHEFVRLW